MPNYKDNLSIDHMLELEFKGKDFDQSEYTQPKQISVHTGSFVEILQFFTTEFSLAWHWLSMFFIIMLHAINISTLHQHCVKTSNIVQPKNYYKTYRMELYQKNSFMEWPN